MFMIEKTLTGILINNFFFVTMIGFQLYCMGNPKITKKIYTKEFYENMSMKVDFKIYANISHILLIVFTISFNFIK